MRPMDLLAHRHLIYPAPPGLKEMTLMAHIVGVTINILPAGLVPHALDEKIMRVDLIGRTALIVLSVVALDAHGLQGSEVA